MLRRYPRLWITIAVLSLGVIVALRDSSLAHALWMLGVVVAGAPLVLRTIRDALHGHFATDIVASLSIIGAVALGEPLAGFVIVLMQTGGEALERYAEGRASAALDALEQAAPRIAHVERDAGTRVEDIAATQVVIGDVLIVRPGDVLACDGVVIDGQSDVDMSSLTGEPMPVHVAASARVMSGTINALGSFRYRASAIAEQSQYARIVELVRGAQGTKAPLQRLADRYAVWFTPMTILICVIAVAVTHDPLRALAILVVATPCPLILATPVALIGGINRAARRFVIVRNGEAIERLTAINTVVFDKTGTLTVGEPRLHSVERIARVSDETVLSLAASVEQRSSHPLARVVVDAARTNGFAMREVTDAAETPGQGISAAVDGKCVRVGSRAFILSHAIDGEAVAPTLEPPGATLCAYVSIDDHLVAVLVFADELRADLPPLLEGLRAGGVDRLVLLSGDHTPTAQEMAKRAGIAEAYGDLLPGDKAAFVRELQAEHRVVMMVGDGINDAPALAAADVGVALAAKGGGISAESASVVILTDAIARVFDAIQIARRSMRIARQSIWVGLSLSAVAMLVAAFGFLPPLPGAALQEAIDVAVILNAVRAARDPHVRAGEARLSASRGAAPVLPPVTDDVSTLRA
jgi:heavy metal translocating P-type ATPase